MTNYRQPKHTPLQPLQAKFAKAIRDTGLTMTELSAKAGMNRSYVSELLCGRHRGSLDTWFWLLEAAGVEVGTRSKTLIKP